MVEVIADAATKSFWEVWAQPASTVLAAAGVYWGVRASIRSNHDQASKEHRDTLNRLLTEKLEEVARQRRDDLRTAYLRFTSACLRYSAACVARTQASVVTKEFDKADKERGGGELDWHGKLLLERVLDFGTSADREIVSGRKQLQRAVARIMLTDHDAARIQETEEIANETIRIDIQADETSGSRSNELATEFARKVGRAIEAEYLEDLKRARDGKARLPSK